MSPLVLLEGIELSTSPLPRGCSTTELQQRRAARYTPGQQGGASATVQSIRWASTMTGTRQPRPDQGTTATAEAQKADRLRREAEALRANLRKRKEQERARKAEPENSD
jgi:hypothetical protein